MFVRIGNFVFPLAEAQGIRLIGKQGIILRSGQSIDGAVEILGVEGVNQLLEKAQRQESTNELYDKEPDELLSEPEDPLF